MLFLLHHCQHSNQKSIHDLGRIPKFLSFSSLRKSTCIIMSITPIYLEMFFHLYLSFLIVKYLPDDNENPIFQLTTLGILFICGFTIQLLNYSTIEARSFLELVLRQPSIISRIPCRMLFVQTLSAMSSGTLSGIKCMLCICICWTEKAKTTERIL
jgi:hypothetical protein